MSFTLYADEIKNCTFLPNHLYFPYTLHYTLSSKLYTLCFLPSSRPLKQIQAQALCILMVMVFMVNLGM